MPGHTSIVAPAGEAVIAAPIVANDPFLQVPTYSVGGGPPKLADAFDPPIAISKSATAAARAIVPPMPYRAFIESLPEKMSP
jgi:hypothetical protein